MKRIITLSAVLLLLLGLLSGCRSTKQDSSTGEPAGTVETLPPDTSTQETSSVETLPVETIPQETGPLLNPTAPSLPIETIPRTTDDSDYQLPPGERPTTNPQIK